MAVLSVEKLLLRVRVCVESVEVTLLCDLHVLWTMWVERIFAILYYYFGCSRETYVENNIVHMCGCPFVCFEILGC